MAEFKISGTLTQEDISGTLSTAPKTISGSQSVGLVGGVRSVNNTYPDLTGNVDVTHDSTRGKNDNPDFQHLTNSERFEGVLATGNAVLPTVKDVADNLELIGTNFTISLNFVETYSSDFFNEVDFKIVSIETNPNQLIVILVNNVAYTIGGTISRFDKVTITPLLTGYVILNCKVV